MILKFILAIVLWGNTAMYHDIHVSVCEVEFKEDNVEITLKTFLDDLQLALGLSPGEEVPEDYTSADVMIENYVQSKIQILIDGKMAKIELYDISASPDAIWITLKSVDHDNFGPQVELKSSFLTEVYSDQTNIINIKKDGKKESFILNNKKTIASYEF